MFERRHGFLTAMLLAGSALVCACGPRSSGGRSEARSEPGPEVRIDLAVKLADAEISRETTFLDIGTEAAASRLHGGWSWLEAGSSGETFVWALNGASQASFPLTEARDLELRFRARPFRSPQATPQTVAIAVNEMPVQETILRHGWAVYSVALPRHRLRAGLNRFDLRYRHADSPGPADRRRLSAAWDWLALVEPGTDAAITQSSMPNASPGQPSEPATDADTPAVAARTDRLTLEPGAIAEYPFELPGAAVFSISEIQFAGPGALVATITDEGGAQRELDRWTESGIDIEIPLTDRDGLYRLELSLAQAGTGRGGGVRLTAPEIRYRAAGPIPNPALESRSEARTGGAVGASDPSRTATSGRPNIILYLVDTLRADRLQVYGHDRETSPRLSAFAADAVLFETGVAQAPWTLPSTASIFTGRWPLEHGAIGHDSKIPDQLATLPELLGAAGYRTGGVVANGYIAPERGFARGFELFERERSGEPGTRRLLDSALDWIDGGRRDGSEAAPFFLYVHTIEPHAPYAPPQPYRDTFAPGIDAPELGTTELLELLKKKKRPSTPEIVAHQLALYDAEIAYMDAELGRFLDELEARGLYRDALILFVSDHGEEFFEHGSWSHGQSLYAEMIGVPFLLKLPANTGGGSRSPVPVQHLDILPTLLDAADAEIPDDLQGSSLLDWPELAGTRSRLAVFSALGGQQTSAVTERWKAMARTRRPDTATSRLFDRFGDPGEFEDVAGQHSVVTSLLTSRIRRQLRERGVPVATPTVEPDEATRRELRALGYLD